MPARWLMFATLSLGFGLGLLGSLWTQSPTKSYVLPQPTPAAPMVLTVVIPYPVTVTPSPVPTLDPWKLTATAAPTSTRLPLPTVTPTPTLIWMTDDTEATR